jgi:uncharacterized protein (TIGR03435 family)
MTIRIARRLNVGKILLAAAGVWAASGPPVVSLLKAQQAAPSQTAPLPGKPLTFDVASVKPFSQASVSGGRKGGGGGATGPGTSDPGRIHYTAIRLKDLLMTAYSVKDFQIVGPGWLDNIDETTRFTIDATMPPETTKEQLREMLQSLLAERFKLTIHRETRVYPKYSMIVAKNGPKMKESAEMPAPKDDAASAARGGRGRGSTDAYGFPNWQTPPEGGTWRFFMNGRGRIGGARATMQDLANELTIYAFRTPVTDDTGLKGKYDFILTYSVTGWNGPTVALPDAVDPLPDVFGAVQSQLGLRLEPKKGPVEVIVIDSIEKKPTAN